MTSFPQIDLGRILQHESSQQRAWEELSFLLVPDIALLPGLHSGRGGVADVFLVEGVGGDRGLALSAV